MASTPAPFSRTTINKARAAYVAGQIADVENIPCSCGAPRADHTGPTHGGGNAATGCVKYREDQLAGMVARAHHSRDHGFADSLAAYDRMSRAKAPKKRAGTVSVRPSDLYGCRRAVWYRETPPEGYEPASTDQRAAWMGGLIHEEFARRRAALYPWRMYEGAVRVAGSERDYRYDEFDPITGTLYEIKTAGDWRWEQVGQDGPELKWRAQAMLYAKLLRALGYAVETVVLLVLQREGGREEPFEYVYDEELAQKALSWIADTALMIEVGIEPERDEPGPETSTMCRKLCPARNHCWNIPQAEAMGHTPESLTFLLSRPGDDEIAAKLDELVTLGESRRHIEAQEKALKTEMANVFIRPYGDFLPVKGGTSSTDYTSWMQAVRLWAQLPVFVRSADMPEPQQKKGKYYRWKRERLAVKIKRSKAKAKVLAESAAALDAPLEQLAEAS